MTLFLMTALALTPANWLDDAAAAEKLQTGLRVPYVYRERQMNWNLDAKGQKKKDAPDVTRVYEHIFLEGAPYKQLIERNGKPLTGAELAKRDEARQKEATRRQEERRAKKPFLPGNRTVRLGKLEELAAAYHLKLAAEEEVNGFPCVVIEAEPNGLADTPGNKELQSYRQRLWIHRDLKVLVQRRAEVIGPDSEILTGSILTFRWAPLPESQRHEFTGYRRFQVESTITAEPR